MLVRQGENCHRMVTVCLIVTSAPKSIFSTTSVDLQWLKASEPEINPWPTGQGLPSSSGLQCSGLLPSFGADISYPCHTALDLDLFHGAAKK